MMITVTMEYNRYSRTVDVIQKLGENEANWPSFIIRAAFAGVWRGLEVWALTHSKPNQVYLVYHEVQ